MATKQEDAATSGSVTVVEERENVDGSTDDVKEDGELLLRLREPDATPRVRWAAETVDNEHLGKKKSKCCCIYKKQRRWDESSSDSEDECETGHCRGHVEKRRQGPPGDGDDGGVGPSDGDDGHQNAA
ncbi:Protein phosphatase inhibitor containing protein [Aphelenchoides avenae]|nr:Protein phosphatase inhibitor containing protein [Aphelenchus avenae]